MRLITKQQQQAGEKMDRELAQGARGTGCEPREILRNPVRSGTLKSICVVEYVHSKKFAPSQSGVYDGLSVRTQVFVLSYRATSVFIVLALLLIGSGRAQEKADRIDALNKQLQSSDKKARMSAVNTIVEIGPEAAATIPNLTTILRNRNENVEVRASAALALGRIGSQAKAAVPDLSAVLRDRNENVYLRASSASALGDIESEAAAAVPDLITALRDQDKNVRKSAASALGEIGSEATAAVPDLIAVLRDQHEDVQVRKSAASALGSIRPEAKKVVPDLIAVLRNRHEDVQVRKSVASVLGYIGPEAKEVVPDLISILENQSEEIEFRLDSAFALGLIGAEAREAVPTLTAALKDRERRVHDVAAAALGRIAMALFYTGSAKDLARLKESYETMIAHTDPTVREEAVAVKQTIDYLESLWWGNLRRRTLKIINDYPYISGGAAAYLILQLTWLLFFWFRPLLLLKIISSLSQIGEKFKIPWVDISIPLKSASVFPLFHYHPRLLDAWVQNHLASARDNFARKQTVAQRKIHVTMPTHIDEHVYASPSAKSLQPIFDKKKGTLLIAGEGGAGKTSLACQMAAWAMADEPEQRLCKSHRMLPILIEANLAPIDNKNALVETIRGDLRELIGEPEPIFEELLMQLLRKRRVLVIVDSLSELDEMTRKSVRPAQTDFPVATLVVTSRIDEDLSGALKTILRPLRLKSDRLSTFMDRYLGQLGKRDLFNDQEYFDACRRLSQLVSGREITVLIAKMYAEQMIAAKEADLDTQSSGRDLPGNLPDLMLGYVKRLNDQVKASRQDIGKVINVAKIVAWECLKQTCRSTIAKRDDALKALVKEPDAEHLLKYLDERLQIIQTTGPISELIRFSLDPLAEYLAALYLVERCGKFEDLWRELFEHAEKQPGAPETIKGFLLTVRDCCRVRGSEHDVPEWIIDELDRLADFDPEAAKAVLLKQRINRWVTNLKSPDAEDRSTAAVMLGKIGPAAKDATPTLIAALEDPVYDVCQSAAFALARIGSEAKEAIPVLIAALELGDRDLSQSAAWALGRIGPSAIATLIDMLKDQHTPVRIRAAQTLGRAGVGGKEVVDALAIALEDESSDVRCSVAEALRKIGTQAKEVMPALVTALKDQSLDVRVATAKVLEMLGPEAREAVPALFATLKDQSADVRRSAALALGSIGPDAREAIPTLVSALKDQSADVRRSAALALGNIGPDAREAVPALIAALKYQDEEAHGHASLALEQIRPDVKETLLALITSFDLQDKDISSSAALALGKIGPDAKEAVPALIALLNGQNKETRIFAAISLGKIGYVMKEIVPMLIEGVERLSHHNKDLCVSAAEILGRIGPEAKEAIPALIATLEYQKDREYLKDRDICRSVAEALKRIDPAITIDELTTSF
jgi:HEAT repeat protein